MLYEQYRDDLLNRFVSHTFTETTIQSMTLVEFKDAGDAVIGSSLKLDLVGAYRSIREDLVALRSEVMIVVTEAQRDAWTGTPFDGEGPIFNTDGAAECYDGTAWTPL